MARPFRIAQVHLEGTDVPHTWHFPAGVTVIVGAIGGGKTSLLNLIKYGLGGDAPITAEIKGAATGVRLGLEFDKRRVAISRAFGRNVVTVDEDRKPRRTFGVNNGMSHPWLSEFLLEAVGIPRVRVPKSRTQRSSDLVAVSFQDVLTFCYLDQDQVDRSTMYDADPFRGPKRSWVFELLHGIIDDTVTELVEAREELRADMVLRSRRATTVEEFAREKDLRVGEEIVARLAQIEAEEEELQRRLIVARADATAAAEAAAEARASSAASETRLALANTEHERLALEHEGVRRATNQLRRDLDQARQGETARQTLEAFPFVVCPRCEQSLFRRITPADHCVVCLQPDPSRWNDDGQSLNRLSGQLEETSSIEERLADEVKSAAAAVARLAETVAAGQRAVRSIVARATAPHLERANAIHEDIGRLRGERLALKADQSLWIALAVERRQLGQIEPRIEELSADEARRINELAPARQRISDLSEAFDEILRRFTLPWLQTAELDPTSYLPRVNGRTLRELSSGGMKATTNAAYYLAVLVTALRDRNVLTPSFLMLDSIRKDYGAGVKDLARAENIYSYLQTLHDMRHTRGTLSADFQLIVVDNDLPRNFENIFNTIAIDPDQPLIRSG